MSDRRSRRLQEKAEKLKIQQDNPSLWTGLRKPGQPSKIFNRAEAEAEYQSDIEAARILAQKKAAELEGGAPAPTGQAAPTGQTASRLDASPTPRLDAQPASRLDASPTPRLDAQNQSPTGAPPRRETFAEADARTRREKTLSGAFGKPAQLRAQNLEGRKGLFAEMKATAEATGGSQSDYRERAKALGIDDAGYARGIARAEGTAVPTPAAPAPAAPLTGGALARSNIAKMGQAGAVADYFKRRDSEMLAKQSKQIDRATATPPTYRSGEARSATASVTPSFSSMFSREVDNDAAPMPSTPVASFQPTVRSEGGEDFGTFKPKPRGMEYNEAAVNKVRGAMTKVDETINTEIGRVASKYKGAFAELRKTPGKLNQIVDRTNQAGDLFGKNLRKQLGIQ